jgi:hypothetical protein
MINKNVVVHLEPLFALVEAAVSGLASTNDDDPVFRTRKLLPDFGENLFTLTFCLMYIPSFTCRSVLVLIKLWQRRLSQMSG